MRAAERWPPCYLAAMRKGGNKKKKRKEDKGLVQVREIIVCAVKISHCCWRMLLDFFHCSQMQWFITTHKPERGQRSSTCWYLMGNFLIFLQFSTFSYITCSLFTAFNSIFNATLQFPVFPHISFKNVFLSSQPMLVYKPILMFCA